MEYRKGLLFILIAAEIIFSTYLTYTTIIGVTPICFTGQCKIVQDSAYGVIWGVPVSLIGLLSFILLFEIYYFTYKKELRYEFFLAAASIGGAGAIYLLYLQKFVIGALCSNCIAVDGAMLVITCVAWYDYYASKRN